MIMKKKILIAVCAVLMLFLLFNFVWFGWNHIKYKSYIDGMIEIETSSVIAPAYASVDVDGTVRDLIAVLSRKTYRKVACKR